MTAPTLSQATRVRSRCGRLQRRDFEGIARYAPYRMSTSPPTPPSPVSPPAPLPRRKGPVFRPSFTLALLYLAGFFTLFMLILILPELLDVLTEVSPGPEQRQIAERVAREAARPRLLPGLLLALGAVGLGSYLRLLPGLRNR